jgi:hypothetical protein
MHSHTSAERPTLGTPGFLAEPLFLLLSRGACKVEIAFKNVSVCETHNKAKEAWVRNSKIF